MRITIHKFPLTVDGDQVLLMPSNAKFLSVQIQRGSPVLWALVNLDNEERNYHIKTKGTGHDCNDTYLDTYIDTYQLVRGEFIGHVFVRE